MHFTQVSSSPRKKATKHTCKETTKVTKEKHKWKHAECDHVKKAEKKSSEAETFQHMKIKHLSLLKMAM
jgi:beta-N-acetylglucosaminidase